MLTPSFDISGWDVVKDVFVGSGSTAASEVQGELVSDISTCYRLIRTPVNTIKSTQPATSR